MIDLLGKYIQIGFFLVRTKNSEPACASSEMLGRFGCSDWESVWLLGLILNGLSRISDIRECDTELLLVGSEQVVNFPTYRDEQVDRCFKVVDDVGNRTGDHQVFG